MRDAFGGIVNITMIVVFMVIVSGYLAFNVNYTKAFRVKNKIISTFEEYEGKCGPDYPTSNCNTIIDSYMKEVGYNAPDPSKVSTPDGYTCKYGYCFKKGSATTVQGDSIKDTKTTYVFKIITRINIDVPIINKIMSGMTIFQVTGDTQPIVMR